MSKISRLPMTVEKKRRFLQIKRGRDSIQDTQENYKAIISSVFGNYPAEELTRLLQSDTFYSDIIKAYVTILKSNTSLSEAKVRTGLVKALWQSLNEHLQP